MPIGWVKRGVEGIWEPWIEARFRLRNWGPRAVRHFMLIVQDGLLRFKEENGGSLPDWVGEEVFFQGVAGVAFEEEDVQAALREARMEAGMRTEAAFGELTR